MQSSNWNYFKRDISELDISSPILLPGYGLMSFDEAEIPAKYKFQWETLLGRKWNVKKDSHVLLIFHNGEIVATVFFWIDEKANTGEFHVAFCKKEHRQKGFYKYLILKCLIMMKERGVKTAIAITSKQFLWPFYESLGFKKGER